MNIKTASGKVADLFADLFNSFASYDKKIVEILSKNGYEKTFDCSYFLPGRYLKQQFMAPICKYRIFKKCDETFIIGLINTLYQGPQHLSDELVSFSEFCWIEDCSQREDARNLSEADVSFQCIENREALKYLKKRFGSN